MAINKSIKPFSKKLAQLTLEDGLVSEEKVQAVLAALRKNPPRKPVAVLKEFLHYVKKEINSSKAVIEYAGKVDDSALEAIRANLSKTYDRPVILETVENADLIAGLRVSIGDDIYDSSVAGRLDNLAKSVK